MSGKEKTTKLEEQEDIEKQEAAKQEGSSSSSKSYGRKKGDKIGKTTLGNYSKRTVDNDLPNVLQDLITKEREAREIIRTQDASRYGELPQLYADIRNLERRRDKFIFQLEHPVDDNPDTEYVVQKYEAFLSGQAAHHSKKGKQGKIPFASGGESFSKGEIQFGMTRKSTQDGFNKLGLSSSQAKRDIFGNALEIPSNIAAEVYEKRPTTKKESDKQDKSTPGEREAKRQKTAEDKKARNKRIIEEGYEAYQKSKFNDKGVLVSYSSEYIAYHEKYKSTDKQKQDADKLYQKRYLKFFATQKPPTAPNDEREEEKKDDPPSAPGGEGGASSSKSSLRGKKGKGKGSDAPKREVGRPGEGSTRAGFIGESLYTGKADVIENILGGLNGEQTKKRINEIRVEETEKDNRDNFDNIVIGTAYNNMADPNWVKENPPGSGPYERNKAVIDYYVSIGVEPPFNYPGEPVSSNIGGDTDTSGGASGSGAGSSSNHDDPDTGRDGVKTEETRRGAPPPFTEEQKQEERDKSFSRTVVSEGKRPGTVEEFDILDADRGAPADLPRTASGITRNMSKDIEKEDKQRNQASIERLKEEIKALHLVYDNNIKEFRENPHKGQKEDALKSNDIKVVRAHHKKMEQTIREYYRSGDADSLNVGVIVPIDTYLQQYLTRSTPQVSNIQTPITGGGSSTTQGAQHRHGHLVKKGNDPFGHSIAASTYYQRGGLNAYRQQPVANHTLKIKTATNVGPLADPKVYVDAPMNNFLQRPLKLSSSLKIKS